MANHSSLPSVVTKAKPILLKTLTNSKHLSYSTDDALELITHQIITIQVQATVIEQILNVMNTSQISQTSIAQYELFEFDGVGVLSYHSKEGVPIVIHLAIRQVQYRELAIGHLVHRIIIDQSDAFIAQDAIFVGASYVRAHSFHPCLLLFLFWHPPLSKGSTRDTIPVLLILSFQQVADVP